MRNERFAAINDKRQHVLVQYIIMRKRFFSTEKLFSLLISVSTLATKSFFLFVYLISCHFLSIFLFNYVYFSFIHKPVYVPPSHSHVLIVDFCDFFCDCIYCYVHAIGYLRTVTVINVKIYIFFYYIYIILWLHSRVSMKIDFCLQRKMLGKDTMEIYKTKRIAENIRNLYHYYCSYKYTFCVFIKCI